MKCPWLAVSPGVWVVMNASASHNILTAPEQTHHFAIDLSINSCGSFYKIYCSNIECLIIREVYRSPASRTYSSYYIIARTSGPQTMHQQYTGELWHCHKHNTVFVSLLVWTSVELFLKHCINLFKPTVVQWCDSDWLLWGLFW